MLLRGWKGGVEGDKRLVNNDYIRKKLTMRKSLLFMLILFSVNRLAAQQVVDLQENTPYPYNGLEYGYYISNGSSKEVKGEDYDRFEINLYVSNKNSCIKMIPLNNNYTGSSGSTSGSDEVQIAEFNCTNATGKRLTAKKGAVAARPWYTNVRIPDETAKDKYRTINAQVGYAIRSGQTFTNKIIVIVPKGEKPKINCRLIYIPEIQ